MSFYRYKKMLLESGYSFYLITTIIKTEFYAAFMPAGFRQEIIHRVFTNNFRDKTIR